MNVNSFIRTAMALALAGFLTIGCSSSDPQEEPEGTENEGGQGTGSEGSDDNGETDSPSQGDDNTSDSDSLRWTLVFEDDFQGTSSEPDEEYWTLCEKGDKTWNRHMSESYDQAYQKDGSLFLIGEMVDGEYLTGGIETRGKFDFQYGKVECKARFVKRPQGNHTGIWMMPSPPAEEWPKSGEIDIMEHLNNEDKIYQTVHSWYLDDMDKTDPKGQEVVDVDDEDWNIYGLIWNSDSLIYTVNGEEYLKYPNLHLSGDDATYQWPFDHPFYIILSQSLGGEDTWEGPIDNSELPAVFEIDWVKVWRQTSETDE